MDDGPIDFDPATMNMNNLQVGRTYNIPAPAPGTSALELRAANNFRGVPLVLAPKRLKSALRRQFYRTKRGRRILAKKRSLYRDAMNWRKMRAKVFNRLYSTYGRARRYSYRKKSYRYRRRR